MKELELDYVKEGLRLLGFSSPQEYLKSRLWKSIYLQVLRAAKGKCRFCEKQASGVYPASCHTDVLLGKRLYSLIPVCGQHREQITSKKTFAALMRRLNARRKHQKQQPSSWTIFSIPLD